MTRRRHPPRPTERERAAVLDFYRTAGEARRRKPDGYTVGTLHPSCDRTRPELDDDHDPLPPAA